jgi:hypothetical protein
LGFTPAITDWSAYSAINFDVQTAVTYWWPQVTIFYSGGSLNCTVSTGANATTSTSAPTTVSISLSGCASQLSGQTVSGVGIYQQNGYGTVHYDNIRLTGGTPAPAPTQLVLQSFESGISALTVYDTSWAAQPTYGSIAQSTSNATAGNYSAAITDTAPASADILIGMDFGGADWSSYRYLKMDVTNSVISSTFYTQLIIASGSGWAQQCYTPMSGNSPTTTAAGKVTLVFDMSTCNNSGAGYTIDKTTIQRVFFLQQLWTGVSYVDNIRLSN